MREIRGLVYSIHAFHMPYADTGLFALYAGTDEADGEGSPSRDVEGEARTLMPAFGAVGGLPQPQITTFEVHNSYAA